VSNAQEWLYKRMPDGVKSVLDAAAWKIVCEFIVKGNASVLLDGYDEIDDDARRQAQELLLTEAFRQSPVVLMSRPSAYSYHH
jgi:hypothetical protein